MGKLSRRRDLKDAHAKLGRKQPLDSFFSTYADFKYDSEASSASEYQRFSRHKNWKRRDAVGEPAWADFRSALVLEFNASFGTDSKDLLAWQTLCKMVGLEELQKLSSCEACETVSAYY